MTRRIHHNSHQPTDCNHLRDVREGLKLPCAWPHCPAGLDEWRFVANLPSGEVQLERRLIQGRAYAWALVGFDKHDDRKNA